MVCPLSFAIYKLLSNPIYVGRIAHKLQVHEGHHPPIVTQDLWEQVQQSLGDHRGAERTKRTRASRAAAQTDPVASLVRQRAHRGSRFRRA
jgi:Recombinase